jgi:DnaJ-domain-containing protein 1
MDNGNSIAMVIVMVLAGLAGFAAVWFLMGLVSSGSPAKGAPAQESPEPDWAKVLEVPPNATREEVRSAYWKKIQDYQPERLAALAPDLQRQAEERVHEINAAFEAAERSRTGR